MPALSPEIVKSVTRAIDERIATEPMKVGTPLLYEFKGHRRLQVSDYRIIYSVDIAEHEVTITSIKHRSESYNKKNKKKHKKKKPLPQSDKKTKKQPFFLSLLKKSCILATVVGFGKTYGRFKS